MRKALLAITAALLMLASLPVPALADGIAGLSKPSLPAHSDSAPIPPGTSPAQAVGAMGAADPVESGEPFSAGPLLSSTVTVRIAPDSSIGSAVYSTRSGDGRNPITFGNFEDGDMVVVLDPFSPTGHAGLFDRRYYSTVNSYAVWSANTKPTNGVLREPCVKYRSYDAAFGLDVPAKRAYRQQARNFAARQSGKPYSLFAKKTDTRSFYCSKLAWAAWYYTAGVDLDGDGGFWVWPADLVSSWRTRVWGFWN